MSSERDLDPEWFCLVHLYYRAETEEDAKAKFQAVMEGTNLVFYIQEIKKNDE